MDALMYYCPQCQIEIGGKTNDQQEAPILYCPRCERVELKLEVECL